MASDVAARGLDIAQISTVIHYDVARTVDTFVHRAGRTAVSAALIRIAQEPCGGNEKDSDDSTGLESPTFIEG